MPTETEWVYKGPKATEDPASASEAKGANWVLFAGIMIVLLGVLNVIYGIAAIGKSAFFDGNADYIISELKTWGWVALAVGALQITAAYSIWRGDSFGRWFGIGMAGLNLVAALMSISAAPFWSLTVAAIDVLVIYGLAAYGGQHKRV